MLRTGGRLATANGDSTPEVVTGLAAQLLDRPVDPVALDRPGWLKDRGRRFFCRRREAIGGGGQHLAGKAGEINPTRHVPERRSALVRPALRPLRRISEATPDKACGLKGSVHRPDLKQCSSSRQGG